MFKDFWLGASIAAVVAFVFHLVWESAHLPLYTGYVGLGGPLSVVVYATLGDVLYTLLAVMVFALVKRDFGWMRRAGAGEYAALAMFGLCIAMFVEYKAMLLHAWAYTPAMPTVFGLGLSPLLQMAILLPLTIYCTKQMLDFILWARQG